LAQQPDAFWAKQPEWACRHRERSWSGLPQGVARLGGIAARGLYYGQANEKSKRIRTLAEWQADRLMEMVGRKEVTIGLDTRKHD